MITMTNEIMNQGKSRNGGWNSLQLRVLGIRGSKKRKGWRKRLIGEEFSEDAIQEFLDLRNKHLEKSLRKKRRKKGKITGWRTRSRFPAVTKGIPWKKQYKNPKWKQKRLQILKRDNYTCMRCGDKDSILHVHHLKYKRGGYIWEVEDKDLITLCETCHEKEHGRKFIY